MHVKILSPLPPPHSVHKHRHTKYVLRLCAGKIVTDLWPLWPVRNSCFNGTDCSYWTNGRQIWVCFTLAGFQRLLHTHKYSALTVGLYLNLNVAVCLSSPLCVKWHVNTCRGSVDWFGPSPVFHLARPCFILTLKYLENSHSCPAKETPRCVVAAFAQLSPFYESLHFQMTLQLVNSCQWESRGWVVVVIGEQEQNVLLHKIAILNVEILYWFNDTKYWYLITNFLKWCQLKLKFGILNYLSQVTF